MINYWFIWNLLIFMRENSNSLTWNFCERRKKISKPVEIYCVILLSHIPILSYRLTSHIRYFFCATFVVLKKKKKKTYRRGKRYKVFSPIKATTTLSIIQPSTDFKRFVIFQCSRRRQILQMSALNSYYEREIHVCSRYVYIFFLFFKPNAPRY